jgi:hypothetical protein
VRRIRDNALDGHLQTGATRSNDEDIEASPINLRAEIDRIQRAPLPDRPHDWFEIFRGCEGEIGQVRGTIEATRRKRRGQSERRPDIRRRRRCSSAD